MNEPTPCAEPLKWEQGWRERNIPMLLEGTRDDTGEPCVTALYVEPRCWAFPSRRLTKTELELWQLGQFAQDLYVGTGHWLTPQGAFKNEQPDFWIPRSSDSGRLHLGVELTVFTPRDRRRIEPWIRRIREGISNSAVSFRHLSGCHINIDIAGEAISRIVRSSETHILDALEQAAPPSPIEDENGVLIGPTELASGSGWSLSGYQLSYESPDPEGCWSPVVTVSHPMEMTLAEVAEDLCSTIVSHEYAGVDWLVVPVFAPDSHGLAMFEDESLMHALLGSDHEPDLTGSPVRVLFHFWSNGRILQMSPERTEVCRGRAEHERRLTVVMQDENGTSHCGPLSFPSVHLLAE